MGSTSLPWLSFFLLSFLQLSWVVNGRNLSGSSFTLIKRDLYHSRYPWKNPYLEFCRIFSILFQREHAWKSGVLPISCWFHEFCSWFWGVLSSIELGLLCSVSFVFYWEITWKDEDFFFLTGDFTFSFLFGIWVFWIGSLIFYLPKSFLGDLYQIELLIHEFRRFPIVSFSDLVS